MANRIRRGHIGALVGSGHALKVPGSIIASSWLEPGPRADRYWEKGGSNATRSVT